MRMAMTFILVAVGYTGAAAAPHEIIEVLRQQVRLRERILLIQKQEVLRLEASKAVGDDPAGRRPRATMRHLSAQILRLERQKRAHYRLRQRRGLPRVPTGADRSLRNLAERLEETEQYLLEGYDTLATLLRGTARKELPDPDAPGSSTGAAVAIDSCTLRTPAHLFERPGAHETRSGRLTYYRHLSGKNVSATPR